MYKLKKAPTPPKELLQLREQVRFLYAFVQESARINEEMKAEVLRLRSELELTSRSTSAIGEPAETPHGVRYKM